MRLPSPLAGWEAALRVFSPELRGVVEPWLGPLRLALGPLPGRARPGEGEPDGYDGLTRRGPPERLLMTDWLLAEQAPDEFLRRGAEGELGYLKLSRVEPVASRRCVVLVDVGPEALGAPRLALLALVLVLCRRAEAAGARLLIGALQRRSVTEYAPPEPLDGRAMERLIKPHLAAGTPEMLAGWRARLAMTDDDELWLLGAPFAARAAGAVSVDDTLEPEPALAVEVRRPSRAHRGGRTLRLRLPPLADCAAALESPLQKKRPPGSPRQDRASPSSLLFSPSGRRLAVLRSDGRRVLVQVGGSPGQLRVWPPGPPSPCVALGWWRSTLIGVQLHSDRLTMEGSPYEPEQARWIPWDEPLVLPPESEPLPLLPHRVWRREQAHYDLDLWVLDRARQLLSLHFTAALKTRTPHIQLLASEVYGMARTLRGAIAVGRSGEDSLHPTGGVHLWNAQGATTPIAAEKLAEVPQVFFGCPDVRTGDGLLVAVEASGGQWVVHCAGRQVTLESGGERVMGVAMDGCWPDQGPALVFYRDGELIIRGLRGSRTLASGVALLPEPVFSTMEPWAAWMTTEGRLVVYHLTQDRVWAEGTT